MTGRSELLNPPPPPAAPSDPRHEKYWAARCSLRFWPISGANLNTSLATFMRDTLLIPQALIDRVGPVEITPVFTNLRSKSKTVDEVSVLFATVEIRDAIRSAAGNMGTNHSSCGMKLEIPQSLRSDFRVLENTAYKMRKKNKGTKTNIRFADDIHGLLLDFQSPNKNWRTITPEVARSLGYTSDTIDSATLSDLV